MYLLTCILLDLTFHLTFLALCMVCTFKIGFSLPQCISKFVNKTCAELKNMDQRFKIHFPFKGIFCCHMHFVNNPPILPPLEGSEGVNPKTQKYLVPKGFRARMKKNVENYQWLAHM